MSTTSTWAGRATAAVAATALLAGCGGGGAPSAAPSPSASFGREAVRADLEAAVVAAGLSQGRTEAGYPGAGRSAGPTATEKERKVAALAARLSPCVVSWSDEGMAGESGADVNAPRRTLDDVLSGLGKRDWERAGPAEEKKVGGGGTYFLAMYKKRGWTLHARYSAMQAWSQTSVMATEDACFDRVTDEELAMIDAL